MGECFDEEVKTKISKRSCLNHQPLICSFSRMTISRITMVIMELAQKHCFIYCRFGTGAGPCNNLVEKVSNIK
jgi:hypothetical protein